jgi:DNA primase catalytic core
MARIPDHEIERLKAEVSVQRLAEAQGIKLERHGADLIGLCPFHEDHNPSLVITPSKNLWNCLGACRGGGSVIDWVEKSKGVSFRHAIELLRVNHPSLTAPGPIVRSRGTTAAVKIKTPFKPSVDDTRVLQDVTDYYHATLKQSPEALKYLQHRGLEHPEMIEHFRLGFSNRTLCYRLPESNRKEGAEIRGRLQRLGILRESGHEHFTGSVVIPVIDLNGTVTEMYGRKITEGLRQGTPLHTYLPGPHKGVWNEQALSISKEIILCESLIDALTFWCADYRNVTASYGVNGFTEDHRQAFKKHGIRKVLIAYDRDEAGEKAAHELAAELIALGIDCYRVLFPKGMDANEYGCKVKPAAKSLGVLLNKVEWLGKGNSPLVAVNEPIETVPEQTEPPATKEKKPEIFSLAAEAAVGPAEPVVSTPPNVIAAPIEIKGDEIAIIQGDRRYRIRGLAKNLSSDILRVNLLAIRGDALHVDTLDLNVDRQKVLFSKRAAEELEVKEEVIRKDLGRVFLQLETIRDEQIRKALDGNDEEVQLSPEEKAAALELLKDPNLLQRILEDFDRCGVVGEETHKLVGYLASISRRLESPLAVVVQSSSAAGKSLLMDSILGFVPEEDKVQYSAMTGQSLFYMGETDLKHKVLAIVEEEGATRAAYALKLLQSEGVLTIASTGKDPTTGKLVTHQYRVEGPVMIFLTTTAIQLDEELLNRCLVLTVNEDRSQTQAIHRQQREQQTIEGLLARNDRINTLRLHRNAQRLLKPVFVANPFARNLTFLDSQTRTRRDHVKYLTLIRSIAMLHQYQRPVKTTVHNGKTVEYIEVTLDDIEIANRLAHEVLGRSLDELPPQTRRLLLMVDEMVTKECARLQMDRTDYRFSRRDVRQCTGWGNTQLKTHLARLEDLEYLLVHHGGRGQSFVYELTFERSAADDKPVLPGLIDVEKLRYDGNWSGLNGDKSGSSRPQVGGVSGGGRVGPEPIKTGLRSRFNRFNGKNTDTGQRETEPVVIVAAGAR